MEWWVGVLIVVVAILAYPLLRATWWHKVSPTWGERRYDRVLLCDKRMNDLARYISDQEASGKDIRTMRSGAGSMRRSKAPGTSTFPPTGEWQDVLVEHLEGGVVYLRERLEEADRQRGSLQLLLKAKRQRSDTLQALSARSLSSNVFFAGVLVGVMLLGDTLMLQIWSDDAQAQTASLIDCREFVDQAEAQRFFVVKGGPSSDPYYLDADGDGIACEPGPPPTAVSQDHAEYCEGFVDYLSDSEAPDATVGERYRQECADYIEQKRGFQRCPAYEGLSFRYFSSLSRSQVDDLTEMQKDEYDFLMNLAEGECVATDVARTSAWQCQPFPYYLAEYEDHFGVPITTYYRDELNERYQVICMGAQIDSGGSRKFPMTYLVGAAIVGAGAVYFYGRYRKNQETGHQP